VSTTTAAPTVSSPETGTRAPDGTKGSLLRAALASEWTKLRSVRSTVYSLFVTIAITIGFGALLSWAFVSRFDRLSVEERATFDATAHSLRGLFLSQLAIGVLGVLVITAEYTTGTIRPTFTAMPQRRTVFAAKAILFGAVAFIVAAISCFPAFAIGQTILASKHINVSLGDPGVFRAVCGATAYLVFVGLLGLGLGTILRRTAGAIATLFGLVLVLPLLALALPSPWNHDVSKILPGQAGQALFAVRPDVDLLSPGVGALVCVAWLIATYAIATVLLSRRDA
jgi:ABC-type transport system involved in multi-copper enzyme maturation permease subunit